MNGINRRGQKVVCIAEFELLDLKTGKNWPGKHPELNSVYTVADFIDNSGVVDLRRSNVDTSVGIELYEIPSAKARPPGSEAYRPLGWPIVAFRPVDERKTDISDLVRLTDRVPA